MLKSLRSLIRPIVAIVYIDGHVTQAYAEIVLRDLKRFNYSRVRSLGLVIQVKQGMAIQLDKIGQMINQLSSLHGFPVYGFCQDRCTLESYYLLARADQIYTHSTTTFTLKTSHPILRIQKIKEQTRTNFPEIDNIQMNKLDKFHLNKLKLFGLPQRLYKYARQYRLISNKHANIENNFAEIPLNMTGTQAINKGYVDKEGCYVDKLNQLYPECDLYDIRYSQKVAFLKSPILLGLFLFKVILKWTIITYLWLSHKEKKKKKKKQLENKQLLSK